MTSAARGTALVTGATGLVGSHLVERLARDGWTVRALVRDAGAARWLSSSGAAAMCTGDVLDARAFAAAAAGCDAIFHTAAAITPATGRGDDAAWEAFRRPNVDGTANAIAAAESSHARLLQLSSVAVYGPDARFASSGGPTIEDGPLAPLPAGAHYARSKRESETMVLDAHRDGRIWATAVRPCVIYGPRDRQFVPRVATAVSRLGIAPMLGDGRTTLAIVHVTSVVDAAVRAITLDAAGGRAYNVANDAPVSVAEFYRLAGEGLGRRVRTIAVPWPLAAAGVAVAARAIGLLRGEGPAAMVGASLDFLGRDNPFGSDRARRELGWTPAVAPEIGIPAAFRAWRAAQHDRAAGSA